MKHIGNLSYTKGARHKSKRVARGAGSGHGNTAGKGHKGQKSRSGATVSRFFEGGQMPLSRRVPKFGFTNRFKKEYQVVNVGLIQELIDNKKISSDNINLEVLYTCGLLSKKDIPLKVLGDGELTTSIKIEAVKFTGSAVEKIEKAGGTVVVNG